MGRLEWRREHDSRCGLALVLGASVAACGADEGRVGPGVEPGAAAGVAANQPERSSPPVAPTLGASELPSAEGFAAPGAELGPAGSLSADQACAAQVVEAEAIERVVEVSVEEEVVVPSVFYLMLDSSGSMVQDPFSLAGLVEQILDLFGLGQSPPSPTKWDFALAGLKSFLADPASAGIELALGYFPDAGTCDGAGYDVPAVPLGVLPESAAALGASLDARVPSGGTPLEGALRGATGFCLEYNAQHPEASCVAVLVTDGAAEECAARSAAELASIAASAAQGGVITYAAGMEGADFGVLDAIGRAGGSDCDPDAPAFACDLTADRDAFVAALNGIRDRTRTQTRVETRVVRELTALPCEWELPAPPSGAPLDPGLVNVELTPPLGEPSALHHVDGAPSCGSSGGWYYDEALAPTRLLACPSTCEQLTAEPETRVDLLFGCATVLR